MEYTKKISTSEAKYYINYDNKNSIASGGGGQSSYNLPSEFLEYTLEHNILKQDPNLDYSRKNDDGDAYVLNDEYSFKLGNGILWLIGNNYDKIDNKFIASIGYQNHKFQLFRKVYKDLSKKQKEYNWFVDLYDKNIQGNELVLNIDEDKKIFKIDIRFRAIKETIYKSEISEESTNSSETIKENNTEYTTFPHNRIIFGAPGTGKSYKLEHDKALFGENFERVTFHPSYSYAQFVGTYKPVPEELIDDNGNTIKTITYKYVPGPFMRTYVKAIKSIEEENPKPYLLLIEEINRANVTSVFGDIFQLLDRENGQSKYEIETSEDMRTYLASQLNGNESDYIKIRIPQNMYIWATMNSADQGVFPMDTAFKRRWNFEYIGINENSDGIKNITVKLGNDKHEINWNNLRMAINNKLSKVCKVNEDKLIGPYFLSKDILKTSETSNYIENNDKFIEAFKNKILMYLFEDAAKQHRQKLFTGCDDYFKYSSICENFEKIGEKIFGEDILSYAEQENNTI